MRNRYQPVIYTKSPMITFKLKTNNIIIILIYFLGGAL